MKTTLYKYVSRPLFFAVMILPAILTSWALSAVEAADRLVEKIVLRFDEYAYGIREAELAKLNIKVAEHLKNQDADVEERVARFREAAIASKEDELRKLKNQIAAARKL